MAKQPRGHVDPLPEALTRPGKAKIDKVDVTKLTEHQRIARIEGLVELIAEHQVTIGKALLELHNRITQMEEPLPGDNLVGFQPAPLIMPGPHPLRPQEK